MVRFKNRYLWFEIQWNDPRVGTELDTMAMVQAIKTSVGTNFGDMGIAAITPSLSVKAFDPDSGLGVVRVSRQHYKWLWASLSLINSLRGHTCSIQVIHISGTLRAELLRNSETQFREENRR